MNAAMMIGLVLSAVGGITPFVAVGCWTLTGCCRPAPPRVTLAAIVALVGGAGAQVGGLWS